MPLVLCHEMYMYINVISHFCFPLVVILGTTCAEHPSHPFSSYQQLVFLMSCNWIIQGLPSHLYNCKNAYHALSIPVPFNILYIFCPVRKGHDTLRTRQFATLQCRLQSHYHPHQVVFKIMGIHPYLQCNVSTVLNRLKCEVGN